MDRRYFSTKEMLRWTINALLGIVIALTLTGFIVALGGCASSKPQVAKDLTTLPAARDATKDAAHKVREATNVVQNSTALIEALNVPETVPHTTELAAAVAQLRDAHATLDQSVTALNAEVKRGAVQDKAVLKLHARVEELEAQQTGWLTKTLGWISAAALIGVAVAALWFRSFQGAIVCGGIFVTCTVGMWLISYKVEIIIAVCVASAAALAWHIYRERITVKQLVATGEAWKPSTLNYKEKANAIQDKVTSRVVHSIKKRLKKPEAAAVEAKPVESK
jgi:hypothetical protein